MFFSLHNKLTIKYSNKEYVYYNKILQSTLEQLSAFEKYNQYISIGNGFPDEEIQNSYHLTNHQKTLELKQSSFQSDISKGEVFGKYLFSVNKSNISCNYITELGLSNNDINPTIYNYFSLITNEQTDGLDISNADEILFEIIIYATINESNSILLTSGGNPFIEFLLGNGIEEIYVFTGSNYSESKRISRELTPNKTLHLCSKTASISDNSLTLDFSVSMAEGVIDEIVFVSDNRVFARKNVKNFNPEISEEQLLSPHANYVIKLEDDISEINSVINQNTSTEETSYHASKYANSFGDKIHLPFSNLFNFETSRFISKDGKLIFFVLNEKVYAYKNENFIVKTLDSKNILDNYITNIISFDDYVFVISKINPYISTYIIKDNEIIQVQNNISSFEKFSEIENLSQVDITLCNNGKFMIGIILSTKTALTIYLDYEETSGFNVIGYLINSKEFNYVLGMYKNSFCDGQIIYLREGETSASCRIVTHYSDLTENDIYSYLAYELTNNATRIYTKGRAIIAEKSTSPSVTIFYYPQIYEYELPLISTEIKNYISHDLNYLIQEHQNKEFNIYNLIGYDTPEEFTTVISTIVETSLITGFEFLNDSLLIFLDSETEGIIAYNLNLNKSQIENLSDTNAEYLVNYTKYDKLGLNNQSVNFNLSTRISL